MASMPQGRRAFAEVWSWLIGQSLLAKKTGATLSLAPMVFNLTTQKAFTDQMLGTSSGRIGKWIWRAGCVLSWLMSLWILGWKATITHHMQVASHTFREKECWQQLKLIVIPEIWRSASCVFFWLALRDSRAKWVVKYGEDSLTHVFVASFSQAVNSI